MINRSLALIALGSVLTLSSAALANGEKTLTVFKSPWCGCCEEWTKAMKAAGYDIVVEDMEDLSAVKTQAGIPDDMQACHTAVIGSDRKYIIEGHVPIEAINKMMSERPDIRGIAVPGMPQGSLGMGNDPSAQYTVYSLGSKPSDEPQTYMTTGQ